MWCALPTAASETEPYQDFPFNWGRVDAASCPLEVGRLPSAEKSIGHVKDWAAQVGFTDTEVTALMGAHTLGRTQTEFSGYSGAWVRNVAQLDGQAYYSDIINKPWVRRTTDGGLHFWLEPTQATIMLNTDMALAWDIGTDESVNTEVCENRGRGACARQSGATNTASNLHVRCALRATR